MILPEIDQSADHLAAAEINRSLSAVLEKFE